LSAADLGVWQPDCARAPINDDLVHLFRRGLPEILTLPQVLAKISRRLQAAYPSIPKALIGADADLFFRNFVHMVAYLTAD